jgi:hypothetical protein
MSNSTDLFLAALQRRIIQSITSSQLFAQRRPIHCFISVSERYTFTSAQPHARPTQQISFSLRYTQENHRRIIWSITSSQLSAQRRPIHRFISVSKRYTPSSWASPHKGTQHSISVSERNHTPSSWASPPHTGAQCSISVSKRN